MVSWCYHKARCVPSSPLKQAAANYTSKIIILKKQQNKKTILPLKESLTLWESVLNNLANVTETRGMDGVCRFVFWWVTLRPRCDSHLKTPQSLQEEEGYCNVRVCNETINKSITLKKMGGDNSSQCSAALAGSCAGAAPRLNCVWHGHSTQGGVGGYPTRGGLFLNIFYKISHKQPCVACVISTQSCPFRHTTCYLSMN